MSCIYLYPIELHELKGPKQEEIELSDDSRGIFSHAAFLYALGPFFWVRDF